VSHLHESFLTRLLYKQGSV